MEQGAARQFKGAWSDDGASASKSKSKFYASLFWESKLLRWIVLGTHLRITYFSSNSGVLNRGNLYGSWFFLVFTIKDIERERQREMAVGLAQPVALTIAHSSGSGSRFFLPFSLSVYLIYVFIEE